MLGINVGTQPNAPAAVKLDFSSAAILSAIIWIGNLAVSITSSLGTGSSVALPYQVSRILIGIVGFGFCIALHFILPRRRVHDFWTNFGKTVLYCIPPCAAVTIYAYYQFQWLAGAPEESQSLLYWLAFAFAYYLWIFVSWAALYTGLVAVHQMLERSRRAVEMESKAHEAQLLALRYQLNPHFFFNVLNTLSGLISRRRLREAEDVIINMADFLRYSLVESATDLVPLRREVTAQQNYLDIEKIRFGDRLAVHVDVPPDCEDLAVPALILQPLVENAVKHGIGRSEMTVPVVIAARCRDHFLYCSVENGPIGESPAALAGLGIGLRNVAQRIHAIYGDAATLESGPTAEGGWTSELKLPVWRTVE